MGVLEDMGDLVVMEGLEAMGDLEVMEDQEDQGDQEGMEVMAVDTTNLVITTKEAITMDTKDTGIHRV